MTDIALCINDRHEAGILRAMLLRRFAELHVAAAVGIYYEKSAFTDALRTTRFSLVLIDTAFDTQRGLALAEAMRDHGELCPIAFISSDQALALACFRVHPSGYFTWPVEYSLLCSLLDWHKELFAPSMRALQVMSERIPRSIFFHDLFSVTVSGRTASLRTASENILTNRSLAEFERTLDPSCFARCSRTAIVNLDRVATLTDNGRALALDDGSTVSVSAEKFGGVSALLNVRRAYLEKLYKADK